MSHLFFHWFDLAGRHIRQQPDTRSGMEYQYTGHLTHRFLTLEVVFVTTKRPSCGAAGLPGNSSSMDALMPFSLSTPWGPAPWDGEWGRLWESPSRPGLPVTSRDQARTGEPRF